jgi:hypothetical protein
MTKVTATQEFIFYPTMLISVIDKLNGHAQLRKRKDWDVACNGLKV